MEKENEEKIQYGYIEKIREIVSEKNARRGQAMTYFIETLGCQMNAKDSEKLAGILEKSGFRPSEKEETADFVLYNTCTVRENANEKIYGHLGQMKNRKKQNPELLIGLCGCMMQEKDEVETVRKKYPFVNIVFGTHNIYMLAELLYRVLRGEKRVISVWDEAGAIVEHLPAERKYRFKSGVNIMYGCDNFCSYCIVPYVRGRERSREPSDILEEIRELVKDGVREVMLLGQNVNSYGKTLKNPMTFSELLREVVKIDGLLRVRFMTSHPKDLSDELIETIAENPKICRHFHLPMQSGSDRILKEMNRHYTKEHYLSRVRKLRERIPDISLTTDIIVGFPGETEEDFQETLDMVSRVRFDSAFTFLYSKRTGTAAARMGNQVPDDIAKERFQRLLRLVQTIGAEESGKDEGKVLPVLTEEVNRQDPSLLTGRLSNNVLVHFQGDPSLIGTMQNVLLKESKGFYYIGERVD